MATSVSGTSTSPSATISGIISGLDTDSIISQLMQVAQVPITTLQTNKASLQAKLAVWQELNTRLDAFKSNASSLSDMSSFQQNNVDVSNTDYLNATASTDAMQGSYSISVVKLAQNNQLISTGYDSLNSVVGTGGTIQIGTGTNTPKTITIDNTDNTLTGLRDAINNAGAGVTASIINDGSGTNPYHLIINSSTSGTAGKINITNSITSSTGPIAFNTLQSEQDADIKLGSGSTAVDIYSSSNTITQAIPGVTINLKKADPNVPITLNVSTDTSGIQNSIQSFVDQYNNLADYIGQQFSFDSTTNTSGLLMGDLTLTNIQSDLSSDITRSVTGLNGSLQTLSQIGITLDEKNHLNINYNTLSNALNNNLSDVSKLFTANGYSDNASISFVSATGKTQTPPASGYLIHIDQAAAQARVTSGVAMTGALTNDETLTVNGHDISLKSGMTQDQVLAAINAQTTNTNVHAVWSDANGENTGNYLTFFSNNYGSNANISVVSSQSNQSANITTGIGTSAVTQKSFAGEGGTGTGAAGIDVAGTINGEDATGNGQALSGKSGNKNTDGLQIMVKGSQTGDIGYFHFSAGVAFKEQNSVSDMIDTQNGTVITSENILKDQMANIDTQISDKQSSLNDEETRLRTQFTNMESAMNTLQNTGTFLTQQIQAMQNTNSNSK